jgi:hypothetical protein
VPDKDPGRTFAFAVRLARITSDSRHCSLLTNINNFAQRRKALRHKGFLLIFTPLALSVTFSAYHAVANGRDTSDSGRRRRVFGQAIIGSNAPEMDMAKLGPRSRP